MRSPILLSALVISAALHAPPAAGQELAVVDVPAATAQPLPAELTPDAPAAAEEAGARISARHFIRSLAIGTLAGAGTGVVVGFFTADDCRDGEEWCILSREEEIAIVGVAGAMVGAGVGGVYGLVTGPRRPRTGTAPVTVVPAQGGGLRDGLTVRH